MFGAPFYHGYTRKYIALFGTLFNNIKIERPYGTNQKQTIKVPLIYSSHDKMLAQLNSDPDKDRPAAAITPAMSYELVSPYYDAERKLQTLNRRCFTDSNGTKHQFVGVPYNFDFTLKVYAREEEDGWRVVEQILPYFTPGYTVTANLNPDIGYKVDIPVIFNGIDVDNNSYGPAPDRRSIIWTLKFTLKGEYGGPIDSNSNQIRIIHVNFRSFFGDRDILEEVHIEPGLTANGQPTSVRSESIPVTQIQEDDNYGYIIEILEGPDPHNV
jgi:hypothetical protein